jgi:hypothetical protein
MKPLLLTPLLDAFDLFHVPPLAAVARRYKAIAVPRFFKINMDHALNSWSD